MAEKKPSINYTSRDFTTIKNDLLDYAKRYYPNQFRDFSANSFGSLMLDTVAYVGDILSFYLDYQVNESFITTAIERKNIIKLAQQLGYKPRLTTASYGTLTFFILIPANVTGAPDFNYAPVLKAGSLFKTTGGKTFSLLEDVNFKDQDNNEIVVGDVNTDTGVPTTYAVRARGQAVSGQLFSKEISVGNYEKFRRVRIIDDSISEIVTVNDSNGNVYFEVDYLSQNTVYVPIINKNADKQTVANIMKPISVPRRFVTVVEDGEVYLQFGAGTNENVENVLDPANVFIQQHGKKHITDDSFDPSSLTETDSLGVSPSNTTLTVIYRKNNFNNSNAAVGSITVIDQTIFDFEQTENLSAAAITATRESLEVINEEQFIGSEVFATNDHIRERAFGAYAMQNRIVTQQDLITATYNMPGKFGSVKKASVIQDTDSFNQRNINLYVISEDIDGNLKEASLSIKNNLKTYLSGYKMINDSIDILDAKIINLQINFKVVSYPDTNKFATLDSAKDSLVRFFRDRKNFDIGEPFKITDVFNVLKNNSLVLDVEEVTVTRKTGTSYADSNFSIENAKDKSGRIITCPKDSIFEIKFPNADIVGTVK